MKRYNQGTSQLQTDYTDLERQYNSRQAQNNALRTTAQTTQQAVADAFLPGSGAAIATVQSGLNAVADSTVDKNGIYKNQALNYVSRGLGGDWSLIPDMYKDVFNNQQGNLRNQRRQAEAESRRKQFNNNITAQDNLSKNYTLAKNGKQNVHSRNIELEGREPVFSPKDKNGKRQLLYYKPSDPTHAEGGVKATVVPKYKSGTSKIKAMKKQDYKANGASNIKLKTLIKDHVKMAKGQMDEKKETPKYEAAELKAFRELKKKEPKYKMGTKKLKYNC